MLFSEFVSERVGWYVYALQDPRDGKLFYVGKGRGNRVFQHAQAALATQQDHEMSPKIELINAIHDAGLQVGTFILRHGISSESAAYDVESAVIDAMRLLDPALDNDRFVLTNLVLGHHHASRGLASTDVVISLFDAPPTPDIMDPVLLIKIPGLWHPSMSAEELYRATRFWWKIGPRREKAKYAFSINRSVIREVYSIEGWRAWTDEESDRPGHDEMGLPRRGGARDAALREYLGQAPVQEG
jgi:hypothetical protein